MKELEWTHIILHHSATADGAANEWEAIRRYHTNTLGWRDIGYHFGVERVNSEYLWLKGRPLNMPGAHTYGMNSSAIGVCVVGNFDKTRPSEEALRVLTVNLILLCKQFAIPAENINPHNEYARKSCPGRFFPMYEIKNQVREGLFS